MGDGSTGAEAEATGLGAGLAGMPCPYPIGGEVIGPGPTAAPGDGAGGRPDVGTTGAGGIIGRGCGVGICRA